MLKRKLLILVAGLTALCATPAFAQNEEATASSTPEPVFQGEHSDWRVFVRGEGPDRVCYAISSPTDSRPANVDHGDVYFLVATWASGVAEEQPSFLAGYALRPASPPRTRVGSDSFSMYVSEQEGFIENLRDESRLVDAMRRGSSMRVEAMSDRGTVWAVIPCRSP